MKIVVLAFVAIAASIALQNQSLAVAVGRRCGPGAGAVCDKGLWCEPPAGKCASRTGVCVAVPRFCIARKKSKSFRPVCGCNKKTYSSDCFRRAYKVAKYRDGKC